MARPGNLTCMNRLINRFCWPNISLCRLSTYLKGTILHVEQEKGKKKSVMFLQPNVLRGFSSFNAVILSRQGHLVSFLGFEKNKKIDALSNCYLMTDFIRSHLVRFISSSYKNCQTSYSRYKLTDVVDTQYGIPATMKEVALSEQIINSVTYEDGKFFKNFLWSFVINNYTLSIPIPFNGMTNLLGYSMIWFLCLMAYKLFLGYLMPKPFF